jgi:hypothetical protein
VDAILIATFIVRLVLVPSYIIVEHPVPIPSTAPGPTSSTVFLGSSRPVVEVARPGAIFGHVTQTFEFLDAFYEQWLHSKTAARLPVSLPGYLNNCEKLLKRLITSFQQTGLFPKRKVSPHVSNHNPWPFMSAKEPYNIFFYINNVMKIFKK